MALSGFSICDDIWVIGKDEVLLASLSPLDLGRAGLSYNYIPADGWQSGTYGFRLELHLDGKLYATTAEKTLDVGALSSAHPQAGGASAAVNWVLCLGVGIVLLVILGLLLTLIVRRKKRAEHVA